ncbi:Pectinacetylesterase [Seminavis robusta]|uniref:Pectinacetylesterase n=1 Tax=Seminavis robusta TaxID=568900 RepID=A0A9N8HNW6_9STRA|nr:Pectinacetylesterase [Seminavis robusta]|eukprot:Sro855_g211460.1 Pectinacetylesterase (495) ;mRNA; f:35968-37452
MMQSCGIPCPSVLLILSLFVALLSVVVAQAIDVNFEECRISATETCALSSLSFGKTKIYPGGNTRCYTEEYEYWFQVDKPTVPDGQDYDNNSPDDTYFSNHPGLLLYFEGGGTCWSTDSCPPLAVPFPFNRTNSFFNRSYALNPYQTWTTVIVTYCTGDLFVGDAVTSDGRTYFNGINNTKAVLKWVADNVGNTATEANPIFPAKIVFHGLSAGSIGIVAWQRVLFQWRNQAFQDYPIKPTTTVFFDAFEGLVKLEIQQLTFDAWDFCSNTDLLFTPEEIQLCKQGETDLLRYSHLYLIENYRDILVAHITSKGDLTQYMTYCGGGLSNIETLDPILPDTSLLLDLGFLFGEAIPSFSGSEVAELLGCCQADFYQTMIDRFQEYHALAAKQGQNNVVSYLMNGNGHAWSAVLYFYEISSTTRNSTRLGIDIKGGQPGLAEWIYSIVNRVDGDEIHSVCSPGFGFGTIPDVWPWPFGNYRCDDEVSSQSFAVTDF